MALPFSVPLVHVKAPQVRALLPKDTGVLKVTIILLMDATTVVPQ